VPSRVAVKRFFRDDAGRACQGEDASGWVVQVGGITCEEHLSVGEQGGGKIRPGSGFRHIAGGFEGSRRRIVQFSARQNAVRIAAAGDQNHAVIQQSRSVAHPRHRHITRGGKDSGGRIVELGGG
jgi:hypothetical protein